MIKSWTLNNFKSVRDKIQLNLAPLTIFAGPNSSGKSTIIQSILMTTQTIQSTVSSRSVVLNGHIVQLGSFDDILSNVHDNDEVLVGFELSASDDDTNLSPLRYRRFIRMMQERLPSACTFSFSAKGATSEAENVQLQPRLEECKVEILSSHELDPLADINLKRSALTYDQRIEKYGLNKNELSPMELKSLDHEIIEPKTLPEMPKFYYPVPRRMELVGVSFNHFLPTAFSVVFDEIDERIEELLNLFIDESGHPFRYRYGLEFDEEVKIGKSENFKQIVLKEFKKVVAASDSSRQRTTKAQKAFTKLQKDFTVENVRVLLKQLYEPQRRELRDAFKKRHNELAKVARDDHPPKYAMRLVDLPPQNEYVVDSIQRFFMRSVKYLGPLRNEPKPIYPLSGATDSKDVGIRGEHTAAVLDIHKNTEITYIPSDSFARGEVIAEGQATTLLKAVLDWLKYLGIASHVVTEDKGKIGRELKVTTPQGSSLHDLIHVGVGISQVLPIVVLALMADHGSTLIFEQPELHLHPKVQTRLADFLLSLTMLKKQCIVETHSEHLINRLCYWAAKAKAEQVSENVIIYFVNYVDGQSKYQPIRINKFGVIENWPDGFFDEADANIAAILRAGMEKREREKE